MFLIKVVAETENAISKFELNPRGRPPFDIVFGFQKILIDVLSLNLFGRILNLIITFSHVNFIKSKQIPI